MKVIKPVLVVALTFLLISSCSKADFVPAELTNNTKSTKLDISVDSIYTMYRDQLNTVGLSIGILKNGESHFYGYGETKEGNGSIPDKNTFYEIGSITKTFTAILTTNMLLSQGLDVEAPLRNYLPNDLPTLNRNGTELNFKHILTHTSGLSRMPSNFGTFKNPAKAYADYDERKLYSYLENARLHADPFTEHLYSNLGMGIAGNTLQQNYTMDYGAILGQELTGPLNLKNTTAYFDETDQTKWATGYGINGKEADYWKSLNALDGAGVIKSTAADLLIYAAANLNPPETELGSAIEMTHSLYFEEYEVNDFYKSRNCLGWFEYVNTALPEKTFLWHSGGTAGFNSELFLDLEGKNALVILYNTQVVTDERQLLISDLLKLLSK